MTAKLLAKIISAEICKEHGFIVLSVRVEYASNQPEIGNIRGLQQSMMPQATNEELNHWFDAFSIKRISDLAGQMCFVTTDERDHIVKIEAIPFGESK